VKRWKLLVEWMDGRIETIHLGIWGPGCIEKGHLLGYTKEHRMAESKLTYIIPTENVRWFKVEEDYW
jgi:hypothetical protein